MRLLTCAERGAIHDRSLLSGGRFCRTADDFREVIDREGLSVEVGAFLAGADEIREALMFADWRTETESEARDALLLALLTINHLQNQTGEGDSHEA